MRDSSFRCWCRPASNKNPRIYDPFDFPARRADSVRMTVRNISRRGFLQTAGAGAITVWVPTKANGYTAAEMRAMAADDRLPGVGVSKWELDTPALCVDLDRLEQKLGTRKAKLAT